MKIEQLLTHPSDLIRKLSLILIEENLAIDYIIVNEASIQFYHEHWLMQIYAGTNNLFGTCIWYLEDGKYDQSFLLDINTLPITAFRKIGTFFRSYPDLKILQVVNIIEKYMLNPKAKFKKLPCSFSIVRK